jgi:hypothetical protein
MGIEEASGAQLSRKEKKEYSVVYNFSHSSCQVLLLCVVVASILFASTKIYLLLNQNCKEKTKRKKKSLTISLVGVSVLRSVWQFSVWEGLIGD